MELSSALVKSLASITNDSTSGSASTTAYGTVVAGSSGICVKLDGSDVFTSVSDATDIRIGDRVMVTIENHVATVTANLTVPASGYSASETEATVYDYLKADYLDVVDARVNDLTANYATIGYLTANYITSDYLTSNYITADNINSTYATINTLNTNYLTATQLKASYATIDLANVSVADVGTLFADVGLLTDMTVVDENVTGTLNGVTINADVITAGTLSVDRLLLTGEDGIIYAINASSSGLTETELSEEQYQNYINGTCIVTQSITANQIAAETITGDKIAARTIEAGNLNVTELSAIAANLGTVTAGDITGVTITGAELTSKGDGASYVNINNGIITSVQGDTESSILYDEETGLFGPYYVCTQISHTGFWMFDWGWDGNNYTSNTSPSGAVQILPEGITFYYLSSAPWFYISNTEKQIYMTGGEMNLNGTLSVRDITDRNFSSVTYTEFDGDVISSGSLTVTKKLGWCNVHGVASMTEELSSWVQILDSTVVPAPQDGRARYMTVSSWSASYTRPARIRINAAGGLYINRGGTFEVDFNIVYPIE